MDELKIKSSFMRNIVSQLINKVLYEKIGYRIKVSVNDLDISVIDGKASIHIDADTNFDINDFKKFVKYVDLEDDSRT